jgi:hypothetical protein
MNIEEKHLEDLKEIRSLMERSSRFISLSGLSGVFAGLYALAGAAAGWWFMKQNDLYRYYFRIQSEPLPPEKAEKKLNFILFFFTDAALVLIAALATGIYLTTRQARKKGQSILDKSSKRMLINLAIPLITGGLFCLTLLYHQVIGLIAPATLIFYGLALINGSNFTLTDIKYLGICEIILGLIAVFFVGYGLYFWAIGFGLLHIIYGTIMYFKYER